MDKTKLSRLKEVIFLRSSLIPIDSLEEVFALNDHYSPDQILGELIRASVRQWEYHFPLIWEDKISDIAQLQCCCPGEGMPDGYYKICSNFDLYLKCIISEDQIILVPNTTPKIRVIGSYPYPGAWNSAAVLDYQKPYIYLGQYIGTGFYLRGLCSRPLIQNFTPDGKFTEDSALYWMDIEQGVQGEWFVTQCLVNILEYVRNLKGNLTMPNFSVDIFGAVDIAYQQKKQELDQFYLQSSWRGDLLV